MIFDHFFQHWINREMTSPLMDHFMAGITNFSAWRPLIVLAVLLGLLFGNVRIRVMLLTLALALGMTDGVIVHTIKHLVGRARPLQVEPGVRVVSLVPSSPQIATLFVHPQISSPQVPPLGTKIQGVSFPSSHTANIFVIATVLFLFYRRLGIGAFVIAFLVGYSRIYTGAHWPIDVIAGACIGISNGILITFLMNQIWRKWGECFAPKLAKQYPDFHL